MNETIRLDFRDILRFEQTCRRLGEQTALKAARKNANEKDVVYVGGSMYVLAELLADLGYDR